LNPAKSKQLLGASILSIKPWLANPLELLHFLNMAEELEIPASGTIDDKLLLSMLRDIRRDQREINELLAALTKHIFELEKRLARRLDSPVSLGDMLRGGTKL
jgi:hypothetical protein